MRSVSHDDVCSSLGPGALQVDRRGPLESLLSKVHMPWLRFPLAW